jgi:hypothetical protein
MRQSLWDRLTTRDRAREACFLSGREPDELVAGVIVDAAGRRHWCWKARWRWYADAVTTATPAPVEHQDNGPGVEVRDPVTGC